MLERRCQREELAERVPAQVVLLQQLLDVLGRRPAGTGLEQSAAREQRHDRQHLGARADLEDREQVGEVVAQHVAGHRDGVLTLAEPVQRVLGRRCGREDLDREAVGVVVGEVGLHLGDERRVVRPGLVEPEHRGRAGGAGAGDGELHPVADRDVLRLRGAPDVPRLHGVLEQHVACAVEHLHDAGRGDLEGLVVAAVLLGRLRHEADVRHRADRGGVERTVRDHVVDGRLEDARVRRVRDDGERVVLAAVRRPTACRRCG